MQFTHEIIEYNENLPVKLFFQKIGYVERHWHRSTELLLVLSGEMQIQVGSSRYTLHENDIIAINPNQIHETLGTNCVLVALQVRLSALHYNRVSEDHLYFECNSTVQKDNPAFDRIRELIARMIKINSNQDLYADLLTASCLNQLMHIMLTHFKVTAPADTPLPKKLKILKSITSYIEQHYMEPLSVSSIAESVFLSPTYLSSFFEKSMNMNLSAYIRSIRLNHALDMLLYTDSSIEDIARNNGFPSPRSFADSFRKQLGMLPSQYRKDNSEAAHAPLNSFASMEQGYLYINKEDYFHKLDIYLNSAPSLTDSIPKPMERLNLGTVDAGCVLSENSFSYLNCCSVGRASDILMDSVQQMLRIQQQEIGFRYIKFHDIFADELMVYREDAAGNAVYNFHIVDQITDFLLKVSLKPIIQFSFMPRQLANRSNNQTALSSEPFLISLPYDYEKWGNLVQAMTAHFLDRYGFSEVQDWIFTFWNEAQSGLHFDLNNDDAFFELYRITWQAVKGVNFNLHMASTSYTLCFRPLSALSNYISYMKDHNCLCDSFLLHFYPLPASPQSVNENEMPAPEFIKNRLKDKRYGYLNSDPDAFSKYITIIRDTLPASPQLPVYLSEWGISPSHRELLNDTCYSASYFVRNILLNLNRLDSFGHWCLTDWMKELAFPDTLFHGGLGFFTYNGIKKPSYHAYHFLSKLQKNILANEEGCCISVDDTGNHFGILLYNYFHFSDLYAQGFNLDFSPTERYHVFPDAVDKEISFTLTGILKGKYTIRQHIVNRKHGSCFDTWLAMGAEDLRTPEEVERLADLSQPLIIRNTCILDNSSHHFTYTLEPLEIRLVEFTRKN